MNDLIKDANGKVCNAKIMYNIGHLVMLAIVAFKVLSSDTPDYSGLSILYVGVMAPLSAVYYGRNHTKANSNV